MSTRGKGKRGEDLAVEYLRNVGFEIVERNYKGRRGEIDIIARNKEGLRFVEVRLRKSDTLVPPAETIIKRKKRRIISAAREFLYENHLYDREDCHFDVVTIDEGDDYQIDFIPDAFDGTI